MHYFWDFPKEYGENTALISEQETISYSQLSEIADSISANIPERSFVFLICRNQIAAIAGYIAFLRKRIVAVLLNSSVDHALYENLIRIYQPQFIWCPENYSSELGMYSYGGYKLISTGSDRPQTDDDLAVLVTTSGSTGSPKLVRLSYRNLQANTDSIVEFLGIVKEDKAITTLPMSYVYGLSILQTHLMVGAGIIVTEKTFFDVQFWDLFKKAGATTFGAVPYLYGMLDKLHFLQMDLPYLRYITQAGGKLGKELHERFAKAMLAKGKKFIAMYGATEATARMSYVPAEAAAEKAGSIGFAIPGGRFELIDADGNIIFENDRVGELVYYGPNVMQGYAQNREEIGKGDELHGRLVTGDMAKRDIDGFYYIVGRKNRFLKILGNRINLAEAEELLNENGYEVACVGEDDHMRIYTTSENHAEIVDFISRKTALPPMAFTVITIRSIPRNQAGKILYSELP